MSIIHSGTVNEIYNIAGGFEQSNIDTIKSIIKHMYGTINDYEQYIDFSLSRPGQDVRYALDDTKLKSLGWKPTKKFDKEIGSIVDHYIKQFIW